MVYTSLPDSELVALYIQSRDKEAFSTVYNRYVVNLYRFVYSLCGNREVSEDIVSETFEVLLSEIGSYNGSSKLFTFIASIAKYKLYHWFRSEAQVQRVYAEDEEQVFEKAEPEEIMPIDPQYYEKLPLVLNQLHPNYRDVLEKRYIECKSIAEIAQLYKKEVNNVRVLLHRAIESASETAKALN